MHPAELEQTIKVDKSPIAALGFNPYYQAMSGLRSGRPRVQGRDCFDLASNDYLGLASDERIHDAMIGAVREYGSSLCGTPIATGYACLMAQLERELAGFVGLEAAVILPSCYQANVALFPAVAGPQDLIIVDHYAHASLAQGIKAAGCKIRPFRHNDMAHLEEQLSAAAKFRHTFVVTESVFSTEGSVAPLDVIVGLCRRHGAIPVVDDSHGLGVLGKAGRGILEEQSLGEYPGLYTASLGKALAHIGGMIAGRRAVIDSLRYSCPGLIYSTALPPVCLAGLRCALEIIRHEFGPLSARLWNNHGRLVVALRQAGFALSSAPAPIAAVQGGSTQATLALAKTFFDRELLGTPFVPPSVPEGQGVLRLIAGAKFNAPAMEAVLAAIASIGPNEGL
jgi:7-keto-8-aminopelargonate synthetase-like enzyme